MFSMLAGEMEAEAGLYSRPGHEAHNQPPQHTRYTKSLSDTVSVVRCLLGPGRSSVLSRVMATGSVTSRCRLSPGLTRGHTGAHVGTRCRGSYLDTKPFTYWTF